MSAREREGFTIVEVMVAVVMLSVGIMALVGSSALVSRMVGHGKQATYVGQIAAARLDYLRQIANSTSPACGSAAYKTDSLTTNRLREVWVVGPVVAGDNTRLVHAIVRHRSSRRLVSDTLRTTILCK